MDKLENKYIIPYLEHDLEVKLLENVRDRANNYISKGETSILFGINKQFIELENGRFVSRVDLIKPILRPLSDLNNKEYGEYVYTNEHTIEEFNRNTGSIEALRHSLVLFLISKHFDVFGLIPKGLAIDINTLKK